MSEREGRVSERERRVSEWGGESGREGEWERVSGESE